MLQRRANVYWVSLMVGLISLSSCDRRSPQATPDQSPTPTVVPGTGAIASASPVPSRPEISEKTIEVEGTPVELSLRLFMDQAAPFTTYLPAGEFVTDITAGDRRTIVTFYANFGGVVSPEAYIQIVTPIYSNGLLPSLESSPPLVEEQIMGETGLLAQNNWQLIDHTNVVVYSWAKEHLRFRSVLPNETITGDIYVGEHGGQEFYVLIHYPAEYAEGFDPRASIILDELKFAPDPAS